MKKKHGSDPRTYLNFNILKYLFKKERKRTVDPFKRRKVYAYRLHGILISVLLL